MKLRLQKDKINKNIAHFMRDLGYLHIHDRISGKNSFVKKLRMGQYPRLHAYIKEVEGSFILNLHLDQKKPSYGNAHAHSGEYTGPVVEEEVERIKSLLANP